MKKILMILVPALLLLVGWYLFFRQGDFRVNFRVKTTPGTIYQTIKAWNSSLADATITNSGPLNTLEQRLKIDDRTYVYQWQIKLLNDSTSKVKVYITEPGKSLYNKLAVPLMETPIETDSEKTLKNFYKIIREHINNFRVKVEGTSRIERTYCVYIPLEATQLEKARGMMKNYSLLDSFIAEHEIQTDGVPFVEVTHWDIYGSQLQYNFCYPIVKNDSLPVHELLRYKWVDSTKAVKATYYGNYITSDRSWYALMQYADQNGIKTRNQPIEFFYNNPNFDSDEQNWRAEVFLPIN